MITIIDFNDSFTYNIYSDLLLFSKKISPKTPLEIKVLNYTELGSYLNRLESIDNNKEVFILGPGPGAPCDYESFSFQIAKLLSLDNTFIFGICLGHQMLWKQFGFEISRSHYIIHGGTTELLVDKSFYPNMKKDRTVTVQRYNSLSVKINKSQLESLKSSGWKLVMDIDEIYASYNENILTYQFHPESIGTREKELLFQPIFDFFV